MTPSWIAQLDVTAAFSLLGFVLITIPLFWLLRAWNMGCVLYIFWIGGRCLAGGVNILLWRENAINFAPVWCDIYIRFWTASNVGVISSGLAISHRLYQITNMAIRNPTRAQRRRTIVVDLLIGLGIPVLSIALYWFYEGHRFDILEGVGCIAAIPTTFLSILLWTAWPIPIGLVSARYAFLTFRNVLHHTKELKQLEMVEPGLTLGRYYRLMTLAAADILFTIPLATYVMANNIRFNLYPYRGFADLHFDFGRVDSVAAVVWRQDAETVRVQYFNLRMPIACAVWFFTVFGCTAEALRYYKLALARVAKCFGISLFQGQRTTSEVTEMSFQRRVVDSGHSDTTTQGDQSTTQPAPTEVIDDTGAKVPCTDSRKVPLPAATDSTCHIGRGSLQGNISAMCQVTDPLPVHARPLPSLLSVLSSRSLPLV